jgi:protein-S-isoprenylcysteine O-methyltransferase Ste14
MKFLELKIPPPVVGLCIGFLMWLMPPLAGTLDIPSGIRIAIALALLVVGQGIAIAGMVEFRRAKTTINPVKASSASSLVSGGIYRFTRNPMYLGMLLTLIGWTAYLSNPLALIFLPLFVLYINRFQIGPEERVLSSLFGAPYAAYMGKVRRWV